MTSCWCHISVFENYRFYHRKQAFDKMFASQQGLWSSRFVQSVSRQCRENWIL